MTAHFEPCCSGWIPQSHPRTHAFGKSSSLAKALCRRPKALSKDTLRKSQALFFFPLNGGKPQGSFNSVVLKVWFPNQKEQQPLGTCWECNSQAPPPLHKHHRNDSAIKRNKLLMYTTWRNRWGMTLSPFPKVMIPFL